MKILVLALFVTVGIANMSEVGTKTMFKVGMKTEQAKCETTKNALECYTFINNLKDRDKEAAKDYLKNSAK